jgi:hypothetical protein
MRPSRVSLCAAAVATTLAVAACGGTGSGSGGSTSSPATSAGGQSSTGPTAAGGLHGILLVDQTGLNTIQLRAVNPMTGAVIQTRTFNGGNAEPVEAQSPGATARQAFNSDFTEIAARGPVAADGSSSSGVITQQGVYKPLTAGPSGGYGIKLRKTAFAFDPKGNLWYSAVDGAGSLDQPGQFGYVTSAGKDKLLPAKTDVNSTFELVPDGHGGYTPQSTLAHGDEVYLPGGPEVKRNPVDDVYQIGPYGHVNDMTPETKVEGLPDTGIPWMTLPVDSHRFLGVDVGSPPTEIYLGALVGGMVHLHPLLPKSDQALGDMVVSPDRTRVAFFSTDAGGQTQLYISSLSALKSQPHLVAGFNAPVTNTTGLMAWLP